MPVDRLQHAGSREPQRGAIFGFRALRMHMIKLTQEREITPYKWVHPGEDR
jgi:hypothetical protein